MARSFSLGGVDFLALEDVTVDYCVGAQAAITGPSGSGKSTLLHLFAAIDRPTRGQISWPALGERGALRPGKIGIAFQAPSLVPFLTVAENVALPLVALEDAGNDTREAAVDALRRVELEALADKLPAELSGGEAQRVALARIMVSRPRLMLADEPTGQLDLATAEATMSSLLAFAHETGAGLLVATHDVVLAERFPTVWHMNYGRLTVPKERTP